MVYLCSHELAVRLQREEELKAGAVAAAAPGPAQSAGSGVSLHRQQKAVSAAAAGAGGGSSEDSGATGGGGKEKKPDNVSLRCCLSEIEFRMSRLMLTYLGPFNSTSSNNFSSLLTRC